MNTNGRHVDVSRRLSHGEVQKNQAWGPILQAVKRPYCLIHLPDGTTRSSPDLHSTYCDVHLGFQASSHKLRICAIDVFVCSEVGIDLSAATMYPPSLTCFRTLEHSP